MKVDLHNPKNESPRMRYLIKALSLIAIILVAAMLGVAVTWQAPGLALYSRDWLMRARGSIQPPDQLIIVAIDEPSIARFGRFPWSRRIMADALNKLTPARPKAIALDVLYSDKTTAADDQSLTSAIAQAGNVVVAAQLIEANDARQAVWLRPLSEIETAAAGIGHVNVTTESGGVARTLLLREADDEGTAFWAMAIETIRVGDGLDKDAARELPGMVRLGNRSIPVDYQTQNLIIAAQEIAQESPSALDILHANNLTIDYLGATGSFAGQTISFIDLIDGRVPAERWRDKYVLLGATAAGLGDRLATPFVSREDASGNQHGTLMPGVEVLAHAMDTILRQRFYRQSGDWTAFFCGALIAIGVIGICSFIQGQHESVKQLAAFATLGFAIIAGSYLIYTKLQIIPPLVPMLVAFATATPLVLLRQLLYTSANLDKRIAEMSAANAGLSPVAFEKLNLQVANPAKLIATLCEASAVAILAKKNDSSNDYYKVCDYGAGVPIIQNKRTLQNLVQAVSLQPSVNGSAPHQPTGAAYDAFGNSHSQPTGVTVALHLGNYDDPIGAMILVHPAGREIAVDVLRLGKEIALSYVELINDYAQSSAFRRTVSWPSWLRLPRGIEWKARKLGELNRRMLAQAQFIDRSLQSVEDGLITATVDGKITFVNAHAAQVFGISESSLMGSDLFDRIEELESGIGATNIEGNRQSAKEVLLKLLVERQPVEREIIALSNPVRHYILRLSAVCSEKTASSVALGIVGALSDITRQRELQQMKNDVMAFVSHELKTPLTAIQGMSEVLAQFDVDSQRRREMHLAINDEAKRLGRMIEDYLDITRLESGARPLRIGSMRVTQIIERILLMLEPLAAQRGIGIVRHLSPNLPVIIGDGDLLARALTNLVSNAIKYSPAKSEVIIEAQADSDFLRINVIDHGYGIPADAIHRIFEKFYRVPCVEDIDVNGTGLGLAFVREIVELHGGRVSVKSDVNVGSTFSLNLPLHPKREGLVC